jgi:phosphoribosylformimino-5-aminoimidazole carboxamide ribotide isomerase
MFNVIPVIDLLGGVVVHAKKGERTHYQPMQSQLTLSYQALDIVASLLDVYPFKQLYIADLDAIQRLNTPSVLNFNIIADIKQRYPGLDLWVDAGIKHAEDLNCWHLSGVNLAIGTENFTHLDDFLAIRELLQDNFTLSLDYFSAGYQGPIELIEHSTYWPKNVIVMSLANIGANQGANTPLLNTLQQRSPTTNLYAAGGVRNLEDLQALQTMGVAGALVATALHQQQITTPDLEALHKKSPTHWAFSKLTALKKLL